MKRRKRRKFFGERRGRKRGNGRRFARRLTMLLALLFALQILPEQWMSRILPQEWIPLARPGNWLAWILPEEWGIREYVQELENQAARLAGAASDTARTALGSDSLEVTFLDVGQGDCTLIRLGDHAMLFDCGPDDAGTRIQNYLQKQGIETLDYVVASHADEDHIGGMDVIVTKFECRTIFMMETEKDTKTVRDVREAIRYKGYQTVEPQPGETYELGEARFRILAPIWDYGEDTNNNSIAIRLEYGSTSFLFTGDAEQEEEQDMVANGDELRADVYQAGHHGSRNASSWKFLEAVTPSYTVISCGAGNDYGHPHAETLERLREIGSEIFRTDLQGTVQAVSDGKEISWNTETGG